MISPALLADLLFIAHWGILTECAELVDNETNEESFKQNKIKQKKKKHLNTWCTNAVYIFLITLFLCCTAVLVVIQIRAKYIYIY